VTYWTAKFSLFEAATFLQPIPLNSFISGIYWRSRTTVPCIVRKTTVHG